MYARYLVRVTTAVALVSAVLMTSLFVLDPYGLYPEVPIPKPRTSDDFFWHLRLHKAYKMKQLGAEQLIAGSSRSARLSPARLVASTGTAYNASLPGTSLYEIVRTIEHANEIHPVRRVVVGLDFYMFRADHAAPFDDDRLLRSGAAPLDAVRHLWQVVLDRWRSLYSIDAILDAAASIRGDQRSEHRFAEDGTWEAILPPGWEDEIVFRVLAEQMFDEFQNRSRELTAEHLAALLEYAEQHDIELVLLFSPVHALTMNAIELAGAFELYLDWQRLVVETVEDSNANARLYGFEANPLLVGRSFRSSRAVYQDGVHYTVAVGEAMLDCLLRDRCSDDLRPTRLDSESIEAYLATVAEVPGDYRARYPKDQVDLVHWLAPDRNLPPGRGL